MLLQYIFNDFVLLLINLIFDIKLVKSIKAGLRQKTKFLHAHETEGESQAKNQKILIQNQTVEKKANHMILVNLLIYCFCRLPELIARFYFVFHHDTDLIYDKSSDCSLEIICYLLSNTIQYLYMLSYSFNIFLYYNFITDFRQALRKFLGLKIKQKA